MDTGISALFELNFHHNTGPRTQNLQDSSTPIAANDLFSYESSL